MGATAARRIAGNALWLLMAQGGTRLISFVLGTVLARQLGPPGFGAYVFVLTYVTYFGFLADGGLGQALIRDLARDPARAGRAVNDITSLRLLLATAAYLLMLGLAWATHAPPDRLGAIAVVGLNLFTGAIAGTLTSVLNAREEMRLTALFGLISNVTTAVFVLAVIAAGGPLGYLFVAVAAANGPPLLWLLGRWRRRAARPALTWQPSVWRAALRTSFPYALLGVVSLVYFRIDALLLTWLIGSEATGLYTAAYRLLDAATDVPGVAVAAMFPMLARLHGVDPATLRRAYRTALGALAAMGAVGAVGLWVLAGPLMRLLYGPEFAVSAHVLRLLAPAVFLIAVDTANTMVLYSSQSLRTVVQLSLVTTAANLLLNLVLIPRYSYNGAAIATVLGTALSLLIFTPTVLRYLHDARASSS